ncbi:MAG: cyclic nucleotide-binding domain-containing protein [Rhodospirillales bacterium]|nr:cyclic nucleotide-binding domain-containing protein [Rhodospirillales bacterium]
MSGPAYEPKYFKDMEIIFAEDDRGGEAYFVKSGQVRLTKKIDGKMENLTTVETDAIFGELAILGDMPRHATAVAIGECHCLSINREDLRAIVSETSGEVQGLINFLVTYCEEFLVYEMRGYIPGEAEKPEHRKAFHLLKNGEIQRAIGEIKDPVMTVILRSLYHYAERRLPLELWELL